MATIDGRRGLIEGVDYHREWNPQWFGAHYTLVGATKVAAQEAAEWGGNYFVVEAMCAGPQEAFNGDAVAFHWCAARDLWRYRSDATVTLTPLRVARPDGTVEAVSPTLADQWDAGLAEGERGGPS